MKTDTERAELKISRYLCMLTCLLQEETDDWYRGLLGGPFGYGVTFKNRVFEMQQFSEDEYRSPLFVHRATGLEVDWYKYIGRQINIRPWLPDSFAEGEPPAISVLFRDCVRSLGLTDLRTAYRFYLRAMADHRAATRRSMQVTMEYLKTHPLAFATTINRAYDDGRSGWQKTTHGIRKVY